MCEQRSRGWERASHAHAEWEEEHFRQSGQDEQELRGANERAVFEKLEEGMMSAAKRGEQQRGRAE